jgi:hypothetical protein
MDEGWSETGILIARILWSRKSSTDKDLSAQMDPWHQIDQMRKFWSYHQRRRRISGLWTFKFFVVVVRIVSIFTISQAYFAQSSKFLGKKYFLVLRLPLRHFKAFPKIWRSHVFREAHKRNFELVDETSIFQGHLNIFGACSWLCCAPVDVLAKNVKQNA